MPRTKWSVLAAGALTLATVATAFATPAEARRLRVPGAVVRIVALPLQVIASHVRHSARRYRYAAVAPAAAAGAAEARSYSDVAAAGIARGQGISWTYTFNDLVDDVLQPADGKRYVNARDICAPPTGDSTAAKQGADTMIDALARELQPTPAQRVALDELRAAWLRALDELASACATDTSATPAQRLWATADYLSALWRAAIHIHTPLETFYRSLTDEQKARLNGTSPPAPAARSSANAASQAGFAQRACLETARVIPSWPSGRFEQQLSATPEQRQSLAALRMTSSKMVEFVAGSCPRKTPLTPIARLSAEENQLLTLIFAVQAITQPLGAFFDSLSETQKVRFQAALQ